VTRRAEGSEQLTDPAWLGRLLGDVRGVEQTPMGTVGFSGSTHTRVTATLGDGSTSSLVLKHTRLADDWLAVRSGDQLGREALVVGSQELTGVWDAFESPYLAYATAPGETWLLMHDVGAHIVPDVREPVALGVEDALLGALARLHARFWNAAAMPLWLSRPAQGLMLVGPAILDVDPDAPPRSPVRARIVEGWTEAFHRLPDAAARLLRVPGVEHERRYAHLPRTLVHGDAKVANFAVFPDGRVAAFDWALAGYAPLSGDLGWYLAVNASRLARPKEQVIARYREQLEAVRGERIDVAMWSALVECAIVTGAVSLLWSKALALRDERPGARAEWEWWVERLPAIA
jgi:hypothetical protein